MIKLLVILFILLVVLSLIALRYRRQIQTGIGLYRMFRQVRKASKPPAESTPKGSIEKSESLVSCARCGKWISPSDAVNLRSKTFYCSTKCMERAAKLNSLIDRN